MSSNNYIIKQSQTAKTFMDDTHAYITQLKKISCEAKNQLQEIKKATIDPNIIQTNEKILFVSDHVIRSLDDIMYLAKETVGINRVYLFGNSLDHSKFGVFDGWPGTYWIERAKLQPLMTHHNV